MIQATSKRKVHRLSVIMLPASRKEKSTDSGGFSNIYCKSTKGAFSHHTEGNSSFSSLAPSPSSTQLLLLAVQGGEPGNEATQVSLRRFSLQLWGGGGTRLAVSIDPFLASFPGSTAQCFSKRAVIIIIYSCCCRSTYAIDHAPTDAGGACKTSSQRTRARTTRDHTILITIQFLLPSLPYQ